MKNLRVSPAVLMKLTNKHGVGQREVEQCFENKCGLFLEDTRAQHKTDPASLWFIAPTHSERMLKIVFVFKDGLIHIKTAFEPNPAEIDLYELCGK